MKEINVVIISYKIISLTYLSIIKLIDSSSLSLKKIKININVVHNSITKKQIIFLEHELKNIAYDKEKITMNWNFITPYEKTYEIKINNHFLYSHAAILHWLIKYRLSPDKYLFLDSDCFLHKKFVQYFLSIQENNQDKIFIFPSCMYNKSLTAPMFYCDVSLFRKYCNNIWDIFWLHDLIKIKEDNDSIINYVDTLSNIIKILYQENLNEKIKMIIWKYNTHLKEIKNKRKTFSSFDFDKDFLKIISVDILENYNHPFIKKFIERTRFKNHKKEIFTKI